MDGAVQKPFFGHYQDRNKILEEFAPAAARQLINVVIYAVTHGSISDYSNYIPEDALAGGETDNIPKKAPAAANLFKIRAIPVLRDSHRKIFEVTHLNPNL